MPYSIKQIWNLAIPAKIQHVYVLQVDLLFTLTVSGSVKEIYIMALSVYFLVHSETTYK